MQFLAWCEGRSVTLLGDAAHLMSPFSGEGANRATRDAADLALALVGKEDWRTAIRGYEAAMLARAEEAAVGAAEGIDEVFSEDGLSHILGFMEHMAAHHE